MNFWKTFGAALAAVVVGSGVVFILGLMFGFSFLAMFSTPTNYVPERSALCINLNESIVDSPAISPLGSIDPQTMSISTPLTSLQVLSAIESAANDDNIEGIYLYLNGTGAIDTALLEELRSAIERFKLSGKFVVAFDDNYTQSEYYLASVADRVSLNPEGAISWSGVVLSSTFFKGMLDKLDIEADVMRPSECKYKSAGEPFFLDKMSEANRQQMQALANSMWNNLVEDVAKSRNLSPERVMAIADNIDIYNSQSAKECGFIDAIEYEDQMMDYLEQLGVERNRQGKLNIVSLYDYCASYGMFNPAIVGEKSKNKVGIIYADGQILDGAASSDGYIFGNTLAQQIREARLDDSIKSVVLRVNSPGGSALASEIAWREMVLLQEVKPVVISMGGMAASGGYYISAPADYIFSDKTTITGSIGVFGMMYNIKHLLNNRLGVNVDSVYTSSAAIGPNLFMPMSSEWRKNMLKSVDRVYTTFTSHVAEGRNLPIEEVLKIAEGRVWSGSNAVEIGLVDEIGGFTEAVANATELAGISKNFALYEFNSPLSPFEQWLEGMGTSATVNMGISKSSLYFDEVRNFIIENPMLITNGGIQARVPGDLQLEF